MISDAHEAVLARGLDDAGGRVVYLTPQGGDVTPKRVLPNGSVIWDYVTDAEAAMLAANDPAGGASIVPPRAMEGGATDVRVELTGPTDPATAAPDRP